MVKFTDGVSNLALIGLALKFVNSQELSLNILCKSKDSFHALFKKKSNIPLGNAILKKR